MHHAGASSQGSFTTVWCLTATLAFFILVTRLSKEALQSCFTKRPEWQGQCVQSDQQSQSRWCTPAVPQSGGQGRKITVSLRPLSSPWGVQGQPGLCAKRDLVSKTSKHINKTKPLPFSDKQCGESAHWWWQNWTPEILLHCLFLFINLKGTFSKIAAQPSSPSLNTQISLHSVSTCRKVTWFCDNHKNREMLNPWKNWTFMLKCKGSALLGVYCVYWT